MPSSLEKYDPEYKENVKTNIAGMSGNIANTYTLVPQFKGKYPISPVEFVYFNPKSKSYETIFSKEILINVLEGPSSYSQNNIDLKSSNSITNEISNSKNEFKFIKTKPGLTLLKKSNFIYSMTFYLLLLFPIALIILVLLFFKSKKPSLSEIKDYKSRRANNLAKKYLLESKISLEKKDVFYIALEKALHNFLKSKFLIETSEFNKVKITRLLSEKNIKKESIELFINLIENCEFARFTPASDVAVNNDYKNAVKVISEIDKQI